MPEEINRVLTDHVSSKLFVPTENAKKNLSYEGVRGSTVSIVGDVMYDAALFYKKRARAPQFFDERKLSPNEFVLCTVHRADNTDNHDRLMAIFDGLSAVDEVVVLPLHPRTKSRIRDSGVTLPKNILVVDPVGYLEMVWLEANCSVIATDSGGVQKEAYFHKKGCVTLRDETEWIELVEAGYNKIVGCDAEKIFKAVSEMKGVAIEDSCLYGDGHAGLKIINSLLES